MSTGNNLEEIYSNSIKILKDLIAFKTVSGENNTQLIDYCDNIFIEFSYNVSKLFSVLIINFNYILKS